MWYWHSPFQIAPADLATLKSIGIEELYVRAGTLSTDGEQVVLTLPQQFKKGVPMPIHLVMNADAGMLHRFGDLSMTELAKTIATDYSLAKKAATDDGLSVQGLQLDIDVPTRLLPKYAELLGDLRPLIPKGDKLSITSLTTWFASNDFAEVVDKLDFYAPQFYEASVPASIDEDKPITNLKQLREGLDAAARLGKPFMIGAASYGQALLFDEKGRLAGAYRGLSPSDACRHPALQPDGWVCQDGEERLTVKAIKPGANGRGLGYRIVYRRPTAEAVTSFYKAALIDRPENCTGIAFFRFPEPGEELAMPLPILQAALERRAISPAIRVRTSTARRPFAAIEGHSNSTESELTATIENESDVESCLGPGGLTLEIRFPQGAAEEVRPGSFDVATPFVDDLSTAGHVSLARANGVMLRRSFLGPREKVVCGPILLKGAGRLSVRWTFTEPSGKKTEGEGDTVRFGDK